MLSIESEQVYRNPIQNRKQQEKDICYTVEQKNAIECFWGDYQRQQYGTYLIHGVTGSGKTEVYSGNDCKSGSQRAAGNCSDP